MSILSQVAIPKQQISEDSPKESKHQGSKRNTQISSWSTSSIQSIFTNTNNIRVLDDSNKAGIIPIEDYFCQNPMLQFKGKKWFAYCYENGSLAGLKEIDVDPGKHYSKKYRIDKETKQRIEDTTERKQRGVITGVSRKSRQRMMDICNSIDKLQVDEKEVLFMTLTHGENIQEKDFRKSKKYLKSWNDNLKNLVKRGELLKTDGSVATLDDVWWLWRLEKQKQGRLHYHFCIFGVRYLSAKWIYEKWKSITGVSSRIDIQTSKSWKNTSSYVSKTLAYLTKTQDLKDVGAKMGRHWGLVNRKAYKACSNLLMIPITHAVYKKMKRVLINVNCRVNETPKVTSSGYVLNARWGKKWSKKMKKVFQDPVKKGFRRYMESSSFLNLLGLFMPIEEVML